ncbi:PepSY domain-containing protein [Xanthomonas sp. XNM01]|uniref:PepSY domain-containing protein n=1 Tax=Xanthomonas sp. XNM01 TaxID=2769289 RepID=UPI001785C23B|nr:hypothetical protein [Xanthomonas sp. XNM01]
MLALIPLMLALFQAPEPRVPAPQDDAMSANQQKKVREAVQAGRIVPLEQVLADALRRYPGTLVEVELDGDEYEIEILGRDGVVVELEYDATNGRLKKIEFDD